MSFDVINVPLGDISAVISTTKIIIICYNDTVLSLQLNYCMNTNVSF